MKYLAWLIMGVVFVVTFLLTQDIVLSFAAEIFAVFLMLIFGKQFFFGDRTNSNKKS